MSTKVNKTYIQETNEEKNSTNETSVPFSFYSQINWLTLDVDHINLFPRLHHVLIYIGWVIITRFTHTRRRIKVYRNSTSSSLCSCLRRLFAYIVTVIVIATVAKKPRTLHIICDAERERRSCEASAKARISKPV